MNFKLKKNMKTTTTFISNTQNTNLSGDLKSKFKEARKVKIATAFLKASGLKEIINPLKSFLKNKQNKCTIIAGTDFYLTEPSALYDLYNLNIPNLELYIISQNSKSVFHPKIFYFTSSKESIVYVGSSNLTNGGLISNYEANFKCFINNSRMNEIEEYFTTIINDNRCELIKFQIQIDQYAAKYNVYWTKFKKFKKEVDLEIVDINKSQLNSKLLLKYIEQFKKWKLGNIKRKASSYRDIKEDILLLPTLTKTQFINKLTSILGRFESSGLLRGKKEMFKYYTNIRNTIEYSIKNYTKDQEVVIKYFISQRIAGKLKIFGINKITEILNALDPNRYAVANTRALKTLNYLKVCEFKGANKMSVAEYLRYNNLMKEICKISGLNNLRNTDLLISYIYSKLNNKNKLKVSS